MIKKLNYLPLYIINLKNTLMKYFKIFAILLFSFVISFYSCNEKSKKPKQETVKSLKVSDPTVPLNATTPKPANAESPQNERGVWHYTCLKGCAGGAGSAVNCGNCGSLLVHNSIYHSNSNSTPTSSSPYAIPPNSPVSNPSQNTAGVWHYTCGKGCVGGSGTAGNCGTCGGTLAHNAAYHQ